MNGSPEHRGLASSVRGDLVNFWKGCRICGPHFFHRWWCPELRRSVAIAAVVVTVGAVVILVARGGLNWTFAVPTVAVVWCAAIVIHVAQRRRASRERAS